ncbi:unnamed protein product [Mytilus edulis]|uniref:Uncharacterized protein n=1 Tax=Mytilus edulis TaxID=6550 RepID=A0A8S3SMU5_MYTED|nr:unnamed protein product [Mytilus edulis]
MEWKKTLQASNKNIEKDITSIEKIMHDACNEAIPNYNKSIRTKSTGKSLWNKNISEVSKITKENHALWKKGGAPKDKNNPLKSQLTAAKRLLRKAHRQAYASQREKLANQIMTASSSDKKLFHKLLRTQRSDGNRFTKTLRRGNQTTEKTRTFFICGQTISTSYQIQTIRNCFFKARLVASLVGQIISMQAAMGSVVRLRTRSLYECIMQKASWDSPVLIKEMAFDEVVFWKENVEFLNGKELLDEKVCTSVVYTDASGTGFGGYIVEDSTRTNNRRRNIGSWCDVR